MPDILLSIPPRQGVSFDHTGGVCSTYLSAAFNSIRQVHAYRVMHVSLTKLGAPLLFMHGSARHFDPILKFIGGIRLFQYSDHIDLNVEICI